MQARSQMRQQGHAKPEQADLDGIVRTAGETMGWRPWLTQELLNLFLQSNCALCQRSSETMLCRSCHGQLAACQAQPAGQFQRSGAKVFAWGAYDGALKRTIAALKYNHQPQLGSWLGQQLATAWLAHGFDRTIPKLLIVPIPLAAGRLQHRGYNQAELIARAFADRVGYPVCRQGLIRSRETQAQFQLSGQDRDRNLAGAFELGPALLRSPLRHPILLVDDIYTTGATIRAATSTLHRSRLSVWGCAVVARSGQSFNSTLS